MMPKAWPMLLERFNSGVSHPRTKVLTPYASGPWAPGLAPSSGPYFTSPSNEAAGGTRRNLAKLKRALHFFYKPEVTAALCEGLGEVVASPPRTFLHQDTRCENYFYNVD